MDRVARIKKIMTGSMLKIGILLILLLGLSRLMPAQQPAPDAPITLHADSVPLREVLDGIEQQTGLSFAYSNRLINDRQRVTVHLERAPLRTALEAVFMDMKVRFELVERQIVLKRDRRLKAELTATITRAEGDRLPVRFTISGYVRDALSGEVLIGATVTIPGGSRGTITNSYGFYSITLREQVDQLICSYVGYRQMVIPVAGDIDQTGHFYMEKEVARLGEVTIYSQDDAAIVRTTRSSEERIRPESVRRMPALFGEKDVIKSLAAIPGIKFYGDGSTIFFVRGGTRDQNLITIDEAPVYNPSHLLGFFSTVIPDAIKDIKVYKGDFPASHGGRLSSLVDIRTKDGNMNRFGLDGSAGLLSSRLSLEGPIWKEHISFFISGRRSYIGFPLRLVNENVKDLHFSDFHLKLNYRINRNNRIFFSMYRGVDNFEQQNTEERSSGINWKNNTTTLRWNHLFSDRLFSNLTLLGSTYDYFLNHNIEEKTYWNSHVDNLSLKYDFTWYVLPEATLRFGVLSAAHFHDPGNVYQDGAEWDPGLDLSTKYTREFAGYLSSQFIIGGKISIRAGLRLTNWQNVGPATEYDTVSVISSGFERDSLVVQEHHDGSVYHHYLSPDPRFSMIYRPGRRHVLKLSYSRTSQFQYLITNSISPFTSLEVWLPAGPNVKPQVSNQFTLGYTFRFGSPGLTFDVEGYYKAMRNLIDYRDHAHMLLNPLVEYELRFGNGKAYGLEFILNRERGKLNGWISYTLSRALYQMEGINDGEPYPAYSDRPHDFSVYLSWAPHHRITLTGNFIFMTGSPFSTPTGFYYYDNHQVPIYGERNNDRLPDYHRLDVAINLHLSRPGRRFQHELILSVYNLYNRKNPVALHFNKADDGNGDYVVPYDFYANPELVSTQFYLYGIVPSISYHFSF